MTTTKRPTVNAQHEYITVNFGNGRRLTASYSGAKATGAIPSHVFKAWCALQTATQGGTMIERINAFVANIDALWPEWNVPAPTFTVGQTVSHDFGKRGGVDSGVVTATRGSMVSVTFEKNGRYRMQADLLAGK